MAFELRRVFDAIPKYLLSTIYSEQQGPIFRNSRQLKGPQNYLDVQNIFQQLLSFYCLTDVNLTTTGSSNTRFFFSFFNE